LKFYWEVIELKDLYNKILDFSNLNNEEGMFLYNRAPFEELIFVADEIRKVKRLPALFSLKISAPIERL